MMQRAARLLVRYSHINWALADQTMVSGVNFLTGILLARYLGLEEFGRFTLAWMAVLFVNSLQSGLIVQPMMSIGPKQAEDETSAYYGAVVAQQLAAGGGRAGELELLRRGAGCGRAVPGAAADAGEAGETTPSVSEERSTSRRTH